MLSHLVSCSALLLKWDFQGAVENLLERSSHVQLADGSLVPIDEPCRQLLLLRHLEMSSKGLRCLGLAYKDGLGEFSDYYNESHPAHKKLLDPACYSSIESDLVFVGVVGLRVSNLFVTGLQFAYLKLINCLENL